MKRLIEELKTLLLYPSSFEDAGIICKYEKILGAPILPGSIDVETRKIARVKQIIQLLLDLAKKEV